MKKRTNTERIVFHHSESGDVRLAVVESWHIMRGFSTVGYHAIIHSDGLIEHGRDRSLVGAHALGRNGDSLGVCLMGHFGEYEPTPAQLTAAQQLYHAYSRMYGKNLKVEFHRSKLLPFKNGKLSPCPGRKLDRKDFLEIVLRAKPYEEDA